MRLGAGFPKFIGLMIIFVHFLSACETPLFKLTVAERKAELNWLITKFEHNYAPLEYKQELHGFSWDELKARYQEKVQDDMTNEEFVYLLHSFVAEFKDAHTYLGIVRDLTPEDLTVAYLGFVGFRVHEESQDKLFVYSLLPSYRRSAANFPIHVGDRIVAINGIQLYEFVQQHCAYDLGNEESNRTALIPSVTLFNTFNCKMPAEESAMISFERAGKVQRVRLPWVVRDYFTFIEEQQRAAAQADGICDEDGPYQDFGKLPRAMAAQTDFQTYIGRVLDRIKDQQLGNKRSYFGVHYLSANTLLRPIFVEQSRSCSPRLNADYVQIPNMEFDVRVYPHDQGNVGYIRIPSFDPYDVNYSVFAFQEALEGLQNDYDAQRLVLDLADNGGGLLDYGLRLAAFFKGDERSEPRLEVRLNDGWLDSYRRTALFAENDSVRELARRRYQSFLRQAEKGQWLSDPFTFSDLLLAPEPSDREPKQVVLMVNELCASMCDIFVADLLDNGVATVIGKQTMGAGGNVINHGFSPRLGLTLSQTESLVLRANSEYLENNGVVPHHFYELTLQDLLSDYSGFIDAAVSIALGQ